MSATRRMMMRSGATEWWPIGGVKTQDDFVWYDNKLASARTSGYRDYNGWRASEPILVEGFGKLLFTSSSGAVGYNYFYDADGNPTGSMFNRTGEVSIPSDAKWMRLSSNMNQSLQMTIERIT